MTKINIAAGDIPETDQEVEKILEKMETKPAKKRPLKSRREEPLARKTTKPKTAAKAVVLDGNLEVVTDKKTKQALVRREKKAEKAPTLVSQGKTRLGYTKVTAQIILDVFDDVHAGMTDDEITAKYHLAPGICQWIRTGYSEYKRRFTPELEKLGKTYPEPVYRPRVKQARPESEAGQ